MQPSYPLGLDAFPVPLVLWVVFALACIAFCVFGAIMFWHWKEYSTGKFTTTANMLIYLSVGAGCLCAMAFSALWYGA